MKINPSSGGSDFHFDAECALLCCRLLQVHQNSWPQGLGCRGGKSSYQGDLLISVRYVTVLFWGNLPLKWVLGQRELSTSNVATTCCKAKLEFRTKALPKMTLEQDWMFQLSLFGVRIRLKSMITSKSVKHTEHVFFSSGVRPSWQTKRPDQEHPWKSWFEIKSLILPGNAKGKHHLGKKGFCKN